MDKVTVLLADDHAVVRAGIYNALNELPELTIVGEVGDGMSLLTTLADLQPQCLLIDVTMPHFDPIPTIRHIRKTYPTMKILVVSAYDDDVYVQGLLGAGVNGYHLKDQPLSDLRLAVQRVLAGQRWVSSRLIEKLVTPTLPVVDRPRLTNRQREILELLRQGRDNQRIATVMGLSVKTIENHLTRLYRQLNVQSRLEAVNYALQNPEVLSTSGGQKAQFNRAMLSQVRDEAELAKTPLPVKREIASPAATKQVTVLLVDDNARYRNQLRRMVNKVWSQAQTHEASNTQEAVELAKQVRPQLALVDVVLGDENGIRCTEVLKTAVPRLRIVLMSAYPDREFSRLGLAAGAVALLDKKDLTAAVLQQVLNDIVG